MKAKTDNRSNILNDEAIRMFNRNFEKVVLISLEAALYRKLIPHHKTDNQHESTGA